MFSDTQFWRLIWKEYRQHRAVWLTVLIGTLLLQTVAMVVPLYDHRLLSPWPPLKLAQVVTGLGYGASGIYLLVASATTFSVEHETGAFDFQKLLPVNQPRVFWAKISFSVVSSLLLTTLLWVSTQCVLLRSPASSAS